MNALKVVLGSGILIASNWKSMGKQDGDIVASHLYWQWKCLEDFMVWINLHVDERYRKVAEKEVRDTEEEEVGAINWNVWPIIIRVKEADRKVWLKRLTHASLIPHLLSIALPVPVQLPVPLLYPLQHAAKGGDDHLTKQHAWQWVEAKQALWFRIMINQLVPLKCRIITGRICILAMLSNPLW